MFVFHECDAHFPWQQFLRYFFNSFFTTLWPYFWIFAMMPGTNELPTLDTVDSYMTKLHSLISESPQEHAALAATVRGIINRMSFESCWRWLATRHLVWTVCCKIMPPLAGHCWQHVKTAVVMTLLGSHFYGTTAVVDTAFFLLRWVVWPKTYFWCSKNTVCSIPFIQIHQHPRNRTWCFRLAPSPISTLVLYINGWLCSLYTTEVDSMRVDRSQHSKFQLWA